MGVVAVPGDQREFTTWIYMVREMNDDIRLIRERKYIKEMVETCKV